jgi:hypothetical protein
MKYIVLAALAAALGGCVTTEDRMAQDDAKCASYGLLKGSGPYAQCRMQLENNRAAITASERFANGPAGPIGALIRATE